MMHSNKTIIALFVAATAILGCSKNEQLNEEKPVASNENNTNVVFRLATNTSDPAITRNAEDSYLHVQGTADEYRVDFARVYLFDTATKLFVKRVLLTDLTRRGSDADGNIIYETKRVSVPQGTFDIFVMANSGRDIDYQNENEFLADIDSTTYVRGQISDISKGIVMTNRASENTAIELINQADDTENVVSINLERVLARIDVAKNANSFPLTDESNKQYATITLEGHYLVNLPKYYYSYRHTAVVTSLEEPKWSLNEHFGNVKDVNGYVIDPYFFKKTIDASKFSNGEKYFEHYFADYSNPNAVTWTAFKQTTTTPQYNTAYCLENCAVAPAQKNGYSTGIIFKAKVEPYNNVYKLEGNTLTLITDKSKYPEVLYYYDYKFFDSPQALAAAIGVNSLNMNELSIYQARKYEKTDDGYHCYYTYWIRHLDNYNATNMGVMEFAVVRNNLYRILVTNVASLGYQDPTINPDIPDEGETQLKVVLNVKPWIVRDQTNIVL